MSMTPADDDRLPSGPHIPPSAPHLEGAFSSQLHIFRKTENARREDVSEDEDSLDPKLSSPPGRFLNEESGIVFHSRSEAACSALMERFIPGFRAIEGATYEIPIGCNKFGHMRSIDFRLGNTLVEFHPVRIWRSGRHFGDFESREEWHEFLNEHRRCSRREKAEFKAETMRFLEDRYAAKRIQAIHANPALAHTELIVATSPEDFYYKVIERFSPKPPHLEDFLEMFHEEKGNVIDLRYNGRRPPRNRAGSRRRKDG